jgi:hypothetical protein
MLKPLTAASFILFMSWLGLTVVFVIIGQSQSPADSRISELAYCDEQPCVLGIIPGRTLWKDAQSSLASYPDSDIQAKSIIIPLYPPAEASMYRSVNGAAVGPIYVTFQQPMSLGWIIARFGEPCGISLYVRADMVTLRYPFMLANLHLDPDQQHISIDMPVKTLHFRDASYQSDVQPDLCYDNITDGARNRQWRGFAPVWHYLSHVQ